MTTTIDIQRATAQHYGVSMEWLLSRDQSREIAWPRQTAMYMARRLTNESFPIIGRKFYRDHSTIVHAVQRIPARALEHEPTLKALFSIKQIVASMPASPSLVSRTRLEIAACRALCGQEPYQPASPAADALGGGTACPPSPPAVGGAI